MTFTAVELTDEFLMYDLWIVFMAIRFGLVFTSLIYLLYLAPSHNHFGITTAIAPGVGLEPTSYSRGVYLGYLHKYPTS
ncbi:MAG: hypothetical protein ACRD4W_08825, partial [Nitrososphaeraceae archaeon]